VTTQNGFIWFQKSKTSEWSVLKERMRGCMMILMGPFCDGSLGFRV
jgi:hypothetical protein